jgi:hypothetical protein
MLVTILNLALMAFVLGLLYYTTMLLSYAYEVYDHEYSDAVTFRKWLDDIDHYHKNRTHLYPRSPLKCDTCYSRLQFNEYIRNQMKDEEKLN